MADKKIVEPLNKIASNLSDINNTLKKTNNEKVEEHINYDKMIQDLIADIDGEESLFKPYVQLRDYWKNGTILIIVGYLLIAGLIAYLSNSHALYEGIAVVIAIGALLIAYMSTLKDNTVVANYMWAIEKFKIGETEKEKRLLLRALIKMKSMNSTSKLGTVKAIHPEMFTKKKLLEKLYEQPK
jgi:hypothetical protein